MLADRSDRRGGRLAGCELLPWRATSRAASLLPCCRATQRCHREQIADVNERERANCWLIEVIEKAGGSRAAGCCRVAVRRSAVTASRVADVNERERAIVG